MPGGVCVPGGHACHTRPPPVNRMTDACEYITLSRTSFAGGNKDTDCRTLVLNR